MSDILFRYESFKIIGVCIEIHKSMGMGLKEVNYKDAMEIEFKEKEIRYDRKKRFVVMYKGQQLRNPYFADFIVYDSIFLEIKSCTYIARTACSTSVELPGSLKTEACYNHQFRREITFMEKGNTLIQKDTSNPEKVIRVIRFNSCNIK